MNRKGPFFPSPSLLPDPLIPASTSTDIRARLLHFYQRLQEICGRRAAGSDVAVLDDAFLLWRCLISVVKLGHEVGWKNLGERGREELMELVKAVEPMQPTATGKVLLLLSSFPSLVRSSDVLRRAINADVVEADEANAFLSTTLQAPLAAAAALRFAAAGNFHLASGIVDLMRSADPERNGLAGTHALTLFKILLAVESKNFAQLNSLFTSKSSAALRCCERVGAVEFFLRRRKTRKLAWHAATVALTDALTNPDDAGCACVKTLVSLWIPLQLSHDDDYANFAANVAKMASLAADARVVALIVAALHRQFGSDVVFDIIVDVVVRALKRGKERLEMARSTGDRTAVFRRISGLSLLTATLVDALPAGCCGARLLAAAVACALEPTEEKLSLVASIKGVVDYRSDSSIAERLFVVAPLPMNNEELDSKPKDEMKGQTEDRDSDDDNGERNDDRRETKIETDSKTIPFLCRDERGNEFHLNLDANQDTTEGENEIQFLALPPFFAESHKNSPSSSELKSLLISLLPSDLDPFADWPLLKRRFLHRFLEAGFADEVVEETRGVVEAPSRTEVLPASSTSRRRLLALVPTSTDSVAVVFLAAPLVLAPSSGVDDAAIFDWVERTKSEEPLWGRDGVEEAELVVEYENLFEGYYGEDLDTTSVLKRSLDFSAFIPQRWHLTQRMDPLKSRAVELAVLEEVDARRVDRRLQSLDEADVDAADQDKHLGDSNDDDVSASFVSSSGPVADLRNHLQCPHCPFFGLSINNHLPGHTRSPDRPFHCRYCTYSSMVRQGINRHERLHLEPPKPAAVAAAAAASAASAAEANDDEDDEDGDDEDEEDEEANEANAQNEERRRRREIEKAERLEQRLRLEEERKRVKEEQNLLKRKEKESQKSEMKAQKKLERKRAKESSMFYYDYSTHERGVPVRLEIPNPKSAKTTFSFRCVLNNYEFMRDKWYPDSKINKEDWRCIHNLQSGVVNSPFKCPVRFSTSLVDGKVEIIGGMYLKGITEHNHDRFVSNRVTLALADKEEYFAEEPEDVAAEKAPTDGGGQARKEEAPRTRSTQSPARDVATVQKTEDSLTVVDEPLEPPVLEISRLQNEDDDDDIVLLNEDLCVGEVMLEEILGDEADVEDEDEDDVDREVSKRSSRAVAASANGTAALPLTSSLSSSLSRYQLPKKKREVGERGRREKVFECPDCNQLFKDRKSLVVHLWAHKGDSGSESEGENEEAKKKEQYMKIIRENKIRIKRGDFGVLPWFIENKEEEAQDTSAKGEIKEREDEAADDEDGKENRSRFDDDIEDDDEVKKKKKKRKSEVGKRRSKAAKFDDDDDDEFEDESFRGTKSKVNKRGTAVLFLARIKSLCFACRLRFDDEDAKSAHVADFHAAEAAKDDDDDDSYETAERRQNAALPAALDVDDVEMLWRAAEETEDGAGLRCRVCGAVVAADADMTAHFLAKHWGDSRSKLKKQLGEKKREGVEKPSGTERSLGVEKPKKQQGPRGRPPADHSRSDPSRSDTSAFRIRFGFFPLLRETDHGPEPRTFFETAACLRCMIYFACRRDRKLHLKEVHGDYTRVEPAPSKPFRFTDVRPADEVARETLARCSCFDCGLYFIDDAARNRHLGNNVCVGAGDAAAPPPPDLVDLLPAFTPREVLRCLDCRLTFQDAQKKQKHNYTTHGLKLHLEASSDDDSGEDSTNSPPSAGGPGRRSLLSVYGCAPCGTLFGSAIGAARHRIESHGDEKDNVEWTEQKMRDLKHGDAEALTFLARRACLPCSVYFLNEKLKRVHASRYHPEETTTTPTSGLVADPKPAHSPEDVAFCRECKKRYDSSNKKAMHNYNSHMIRSSWFAEGLAERERGGGGRRSEAEVSVMAKKEEEEEPEEEEEDPPTFLQSLGCHVCSIYFAAEDDQLSHMKEKHPEIELPRAASDFNPSLMTPSVGAEDFLTTSACLRCNFFFLDPQLKMTHDDQKHASSSSGFELRPSKLSPPPAPRLITDLRPAHSNQSFLRCNECDTKFRNRKQKYDHNRYIHSIKFNLASNTASTVTSQNVTDDGAKGKKRKKPKEEETKEDHLYATTFLENFVCVECGVYFVSRVARDVHSRAAHGELISSLLGIKPPSTDFFISLKPHRDATQFLQLRACILCSLFFEDQPQKRRHVEMFHPDEPGLWSSKLTLMRDLRPARTPSLHLECFECRKDFKDPGDKYKHNFFVHGSKIRENKDGENSEISERQKFKTLEKETLEEEKVVKSTDSTRDDSILLETTRNLPAADSISSELVHSESAISTATESAYSIESIANPYAVAATFLESHGCVRCYAYFASRDERRRHLSKVHLETSSCRESVPSDLRFECFAPSLKAKAYLLSQVCMKCKLFFENRSAKDQHDKMHLDETDCSAKLERLSSDLRPALSRSTLSFCLACDKTFKDSQRKGFHNWNVHNVKDEDFPNDDEPPKEKPHTVTDANSEPKSLITLHMQDTHFLLEPPTYDQRRKVSFLYTRTCIQCLEYFSSLQDREAHYIKEHGNSAPSSELIPSNFKFASLKPSMKAVHFVLYQTCFKCLLFFEMYSLKRQHIDSHHKGETGFWSNGKIVQDLMPAHTATELDLDCRECGLGFVTDESKREHNLTRHSTFYRFVHPEEKVGKGVVEKNNETKVEEKRDKEENENVEKNERKGQLENDLTPQISPEVDIDSLEQSDVERIVMPREKRDYYVKNCNEYECCYCDAIHSTVAEAKSHVTNVHWDMHRYECVACGLRNSDQRLLKKHVAEKHHSRLYGVMEESTRPMGSMIKMLTIVQAFSQASPKDEAMRKMLKVFLGKILAKDFSASEEEDEGKVKERENKQEENRNKTKTAIPSLPKQTIVDSPSVFPNQPAGNFKCRYCSKMLEKFDDIIKHYKSVHECKLCKLTANENEMKKHVREQHQKACKLRPELTMSAGKFWCLKCKIYFSSKNILFAHQRAFHKYSNKLCYDLRYPCPICCEDKFGSIELRTVKSFKNHFQSLHGLPLSVVDYNPVIKLPPRKKPCKNCNICGLNFFRKAALLSHIRQSHGYMLTSVCVPCGKGMFTKSSHISHLLVQHKKALWQLRSEKPFACPSCPKKFKFLVVLRMHIEKTHPLAMDISEKIAKEKRLSSAWKVLRRSRLRFTGLGYGHGHMFAKNKPLCFRKFKSKVTPFSVRNLVKKNRVDSLPQPLQNSTRVISIVEEVEVFGRERRSSAKANDVAAMNEWNWLGESVSNVSGFSLLCRDQQIEQLKVWPHVVLESLNLDSTVPNAELENNQKFCENKTNLHNIATSLKQDSISVTNEITKKDLQNENSSLPMTKTHSKPDESNCSIDFIKLCNDQTLSTKVDVGEPENLKANDDNFSITTKTKQICESLTEAEPPLEANKHFEMIVSNEMRAVNENLVLTKIIETDPNKEKRVKEKSQSITIIDGQEKAQITNIITESSTENLLLQKDTMEKTDIKIYVTAKGKESTLLPNTSKPKIYYTSEKKINLSDSSVSNEAPSSSCKIVAEAQPISYLAESNETSLNKENKDITKNKEKEDEIKPFSIELSAEEVAPVDNWAPDYSAFKKHRSVKGSHKLKQTLTKSLPIENKIQKQSQSRWERMQLIQKWTEEQKTLTDMAEDEIVYSDPKKRHAKFSPCTALGSISDAENDVVGSDDDSDLSEDSSLKSSEADGSESDESTIHEKPLDSSHTRMYIPTPKVQLSSSIHPLNVPCVESSSSSSSVALAIDKKQENTVERVRTSSPTKFNSFLPVVTKNIDVNSSLNISVAVASNNRINNHKELNEGKNIESKTTESEADSKNNKNVSFLDRSRSTANQDQMKFSALSGSSALFEKIHSGLNAGISNVTVSKKPQQEELSRTSRETSPSYGRVARMQDPIIDATIQTLKPPVNETPIVTEFQKSVSASAKISFAPSTKLIVPKPVEARVELKKLPQTVPKEKVSLKADIGKEIPSTSPQMVEAIEAPVDHPMKKKLEAPKSSPSPHFPTIRGSFAKVFESIKASKESGIQSRDPDKLGSGETHATNQSIAFSIPTKSYAKRFVKKISGDLSRFGLSDYGSSDSETETCKTEQTPEKSTQPISAPTTEPSATFKTPLGVESSKASPVSARAPGVKNKSPIIKRPISTSSPTPPTQSKTPPPLSKVPSILGPQTSSKELPFSSLAQPTPSRTQPIQSGAQLDMSLARPTLPLALQTSSKVLHISSKTKPSSSLTRPTESLAPQKSSKSPLAPSLAPQTQSLSHQNLSKTPPTTRKAPPTSSKAPPTLSKAPPTSSKAPPTISEAPPPAITQPSPVPKNISASIVVLPQRATKKLEVTTGNIPAFPSTSSSASGSEPDTTGDGGGANVLDDLRSKLENIITVAMPQFGGRPAPNAPTSPPVVSTTAPLIKTEPAELIPAPPRRSFPEDVRREAADSTTSESKLSPIFGDPEPSTSRPFAPPHLSLLQPPSVEPVVKRDEDDDALPTSTESSLIDVSVAGRAAIVANTASIDPSFVDRLAALAADRKPSPCSSTTDFPSVKVSRSSSPINFSDLRDGASDQFRPSSLSDSTSEYEATTRKKRKRKRKGKTKKAKSSTPAKRKKKSRKATKGKGKGKRASSSSKCGKRRRSSTDDDTDDSTTDFAELSVVMRRKRFKKRKKKTTKRDRTSPSEDSSSDSSTDDDDDVDAAQTRKKRRSGADDAEEVRLRRRGGAHELPTSMVANVRLLAPRSTRGVGAGFLDSSSTEEDFDAAELDAARWRSKTPPCHRRRTQQRRHTLSPGNEVKPCVVRLSPLRFDDLRSDSKNDVDTGDAPNKDPDTSGAQSDFDAGSDDGAIALSTSGAETVSPCKVVLWKLENVGKKAPPTPDAAAPSSSSASNSAPKPKRTTFGFNKSLHVGVAGGAEARPFPRLDDDWHCSSDCFDETRDDDDESDVEWAVDTPEKDALRPRRQVGRRTKKPFTSGPKQSRSIEPKSKNLVVESISSPANDDRSHSDYEVAPTDVYITSSSEAGIASSVTADSHPRVVLRDVRLQRETNVARLRGSPNLLRAYETWLKNFSSSDQD